MKKLILMSIVLLSLTVHSQSINIAVGKASDNRWTVKSQFSTPSGFGAYVNHYADYHEFDWNETKVGWLNTQKNATTLGITGDIHKRVTVYVGAGLWHEIESYNDEFGYRYNKERKGYCLEAGGTVRCFYFNRAIISLDYSFNSIMQFNTMIMLGIGF